MTTMMRYRLSIPVTVISMLLACAASAPAVRAQQQGDQNDAPLTDEQIHALTLRVLSNQHQNDMLLEQYDRTEREELRGKGVTNKKTVVRVVPTGTGEAHVELKRDGMPTDAALQQEQWHALTKALLANSRTDDPEVKKEYERAAKRDRERAEIVDALGKAFRFHYVGRVMIGNRKLLELSFEPDPNFHSSLRYAGICAHLKGDVWVDESSAQVVRLDAELFEDYGLAAGIIGKIYQGSRASLEQTEIEPGVWMPARMVYDISGRKFLFAVTMHGETEDSEYRRIGPPREALQTIGREHPSQTAEDVKK